MPRLILPTVLTTVVCLSGAPGAAAKQITAMKVCGADRCVKVERAIAQRWHEDGGLEGPPISAAPRPAAYYRVIIFVGEPGGGPAGQFSLAYMPRPRAVLPLDTDSPAPWMHVSGPAAKRLASVTGGVTPLPAKRLGPDMARAAGGALPPRVFAPASADPAADDGLPRPLLAGVPAVLMLASALSLFALRGRRTAR